MAKHPLNPPRKQRTREHVLADLSANHVEKFALHCGYAEAYPVILVLYDAARERAFWLSIQSHFADQQAFAKLRGKTVTVSIPTDNLISDKAMREFAREKAAILAPQGEGR